MTHQRNAGVLSLAAGLQSSHAHEDAVAPVLAGSQTAGLILFCLTYSLYCVSGIAVDAEGNVYVSDAGLNRILKFTSFVSPNVGLNEMPEDMQLPAGVILDENGKPIMSNLDIPLDAATVEVTQEAAE